MKKLDYTILFKDVMQRKGITDKNTLERVTKYILTLDDDLDTDFDEIKKINVLDWLLEI